MATVAAAADHDGARSGQRVYSGSVTKDRGGEVIAHLSRALGPGSDGRVGGDVGALLSQRRGQTWG